MKPDYVAELETHRHQPPSGGCVLKLLFVVGGVLAVEPAAFGRLCVETVFLKNLPLSNLNQPPSGGCVLKLLK